VLSLEAAEYFSAPPLQAGDSDFPRFIVGEYARALVEIALDECRELLIRLNPRILEQAAEITSHTLPWGAAWSCDLARLEEAVVLRAHPSIIWHILAPLLIQLGAEGIVAEAEIRLESSRRFRWGRIRLPEADRIAFRNTGGRAEATLWRAGAHFSTVSMSKSADDLWTGDGGDNLPVLRFGQFPIVVDSAEYATGKRVPGNASALAELPVGTDSVFAEAAELIATYSPTYLPWVGQVVRTIVPLDVKTGKVSATVAEFPGLVFLSLPIDSFETAMRLVHEASHQYYFALKRLVSLEDGSDRKLYFSPIKLTGRPIDMILFAFHAFGNGALFHRDLSSADGRYALVNGQPLETSMEQLRVMHGYLGETHALTAMGRTLCGPVAERLFGGSEASLAN
jgi:HEXXH motif-containing protein